MPVYVAMQGPAAVAFAVTVLVVVVLRVARRGVALAVAYRRQQVPEAAHVRDFASPRAARPS
nr:hypothetical protein GCM10017745_08110 [Saccharothrix mutabilis subsp. capreolus]